MTKKEFLFEHNESLVIDLVNRHFAFHGATIENNEDVEETEQTSAREFFSF